MSLSRAIKRNKSMSWSKLSLLVNLGIILFSHQIHALELNSGIQKNQLVELYTSEGCNSCPPADNYLSALKTDSKLWKDIIPVAFHVDYWDSSGWSDSFAERAFSARQREYQDKGYISQAYTPEFVINGSEWRGYFSKDILPSVERKDVGILSVNLNRGKLAAHFKSVDKLQTDLVLNVAVLGFNLVSNVKAGENKNVVLHHDFTIIGFKQVQFKSLESMYEGTTMLPIEKKPSNKKAIAVWVSQNGNPAPIQSVGGWL